MAINRFDIYIYSRDKQVDYHFRPLNKQNLINDIIKNFSFDKLIQGPLTEGFSEAPKCAFKYSKNNGACTYIADLITERIDHTGRQISITALIHSDEYNEKLLNIFINAVSGRKKSEMTAWFDDIYHNGFNEEKIDDKLFELEDIRGDSSSQNVGGYLEYKKENVNILSAYAITKLKDHSGLTKDFLIFSGNFLKLSFFDEIKPDLCLYKTLIDDRPEAFSIIGILKNRQINGPLIFIFCAFILLWGISLYKSRSHKNKPVKVTPINSDVPISNPTNEIKILQVVPGTGPADEKKMPLPTVPAKPDNKPTKIEPAVKASSVNNGKKDTKEIDSFKKIMEDKPSKQESK